MGKYIPNSILKAGKVLERLANSRQSIRLSQLSRDLGIGKSSLWGILTALESLEWVEREANGKGYTVGSGLLRLSREAFGSWDLVEIAKPFMEHLSEETGESVFLGVLREDTIVIVECVEGKGEMRVSSPPGTRLPLMAAATAKAILAAMPPEKAAEIVSSQPLPKYTEHSVTDPSRFMEEVERTKRKGYGMDDEEYLRGIRAVACAIKGEPNLPIGAMWIVGFATRFTSEKAQKAGHELARATQRISSLLAAHEKSINKGSQGK